MESEECGLFQISPTDQIPGSENIIMTYSRTRRHDQKYSSLSAIIAQSDPINQKGERDNQNQDFPNSEWRCFFSKIKNLTRAEKRLLRPQLRLELGHVQSLIVKIEEREQELIERRQISKPDDNVQKSGKASGKANHPKNDKLRAGLMKQCGTILKALISHEHSWIFLEPVDAVKLQLPDYHQIISNPMDLGTIQRKLKNNVYSSPLQFAEDVRLTFTNAMRYNRKGDDAHTMADILAQLFESKWRLLSKKLEQLSLMDYGNNEDDVVVQDHVSSPTMPSVAPVHESIIPAVSTPIERHNSRQTDCGNNEDDVVVQGQFFPPTMLSSAPVHESITPAVSTPIEKHDLRQTDDFENEDVNITDGEPETSIPPVVIDRDASPNDGLRGSSSDISSGSSSDGSRDSSSDGSSGSSSDDSSGSSSDGLSGSSSDHSSGSSSDGSSGSSSDGSSSSSDSDKRGPDNLSRDSDSDGADSAQDLTKTVPQKESLHNQLRTNSALTRKGNKKKNVEQEHQVPPERLAWPALFKCPFSDTILKAQEDLPSHKPEGMYPEELRREMEELQRKE